jgi:sorting nexin-9/18/33
MTTLPRSSKYPSASNVIFQRPQSEFDAGINTSTAWTEHLETESVATNTGSLSDEEPDDDAEESRSARALYDFEGKAEFRELSVAAGDDLEVIKEDLADGWSLVKNSAGEVGLLPQTYYTVRLQISPFQGCGSNMLCSLHRNLHLHQISMRLAQIRLLRVQRRPLPAQSP